MSFRQIWTIPKALLAVREGGERGVRDAGEELLERANQHVPLRLGGLRDSGRVDTDGEEAVVSYDTEYAVRLHEHPEYNFEGQGRGKWLEEAVNDSSHRETLKEIGAGLRHVLEGFRR